MKPDSREPIRVCFKRSASVLHFMKWFARQGVRVLPIHGIVDGRCACNMANCESPGKHPISSLVRNGVKGATTDIATIRAWHKKHPQMNYAVATEGLAVIDCDSREAINAFLKEYRPPLTLTTKTARGLHFYFRGEMPARIGAKTKLDVKSGGGSYVVGPASIHSSGAIYALMEDKPIADLPSHIAAIGRDREETSGSVGNAIIPAGMRNTVMTKIAGYLHAQRVPQGAVLDALKALNRTIAESPLTGGELSKIAKSVSRYPVKPLPEMRPFSDVPDEELRWLWYPYICLGTLGLLDGDPGDGKSQFASWLVSEISRGRTLPSGKKAKPANCFLFNFEDLPGAVIKKRLEANGADLDRVFIQSRTFKLTPEMADWLDGEIGKHKPVLAILDPIQAFITGDVDASNNVDVREFMERLKDIGERHGCAIMVVRHFGKGQHDKAMKKGIGATDFVGISRNQFGLARRKDDVRGFIVFHMKTNFERGDAMLFTMGDADGRKGEQPKIGFDRFEKIDVDAFFAGTPTTRGPDQDEREVAKKFLLDMLANEPKAATALKSQAEAWAISASTLDRARKELGIITARNDKNWMWSLPTK